MCFEADVTKFAQSLPNFQGDKFLECSRVSGRNCHESVRARSRLLEYCFHLLSKLHKYYRDSDDSPHGPVVVGPAGMRRLPEDGYVDDVAPDGGAAACSKVLVTGKAAEDQLSHRIWAKVMLQGGKAAAQLKDVAHACGAPRDASSVEEFAAIAASCAGGVDRVTVPSFIALAAKHQARLRKTSCSASWRPLTMVTSCWAAWFPK